MFERLKNNKTMKKTLYDKLRLVNHLIIQICSGGEFNGSNLTSDDGNDHLL